MNQIVYSIIIPTFNRPEALAICLRALSSQVAASSDVEVLVLDDGTEVVTRDLVRGEFPWANWHSGPRRGPAANRNHGACLAQGFWLIFLDDDCIPGSRYLRAYLKAMRRAVSNNSCVLLGPTVCPDDRRSLLQEAPHNPQGSALISCNFAICRELFLELGGFDERFPVAAFEDTDFEARLHATGCAVHFIPDAAVNHPLRNIPNAKKLALRWEARVISALDLGVSPYALLVRLPEHVFKVIVSRFRNQACAPDTIRAALRFTGEFSWLLFFLPGWIRRHAYAQRSPFWASVVAEGRGPSRYGL